MHQVSLRIICAGNFKQKMSATIFMKSIADQSLLNNSLYRLQTNLLDGYNPYIRPVKNPKTVTKIKIDLTLQQVISMVYYLF